MRIVFCGTPDFAVPSLRHLIAQRDFEVVGVVTQPDRPRGRGQEIAIAPIKRTAFEAGIAVYQPEKIKSDEAVEYFTRLAPDVVVIIAYGQIISQRLIDIPRLGWINLHASWLPKYRGAAPINWAIINGERRTGLTTMRIDAGLDTGPILLRYEVDIGPQETASELSARLAEAGAPLMAETLRGFDRGEIVPAPQDSSLATFAPLLKKRDGRIDWSLDARRIHNRIRGLQPWPGAFTAFSGKRCQIWGKPLFDPAIGAVLKSASMNESWLNGTIIVLGRELYVKCGEDTWLQLEFLQMEGRKRVTAHEFELGLRLSSGERFGS